MNTSGARIQAILDHLRLSKNAFAQKIGVSSTVINGIVKDDHKPGSKVLDAIKVEYPTIDTDWILSGSGSMFRTDVKPVEPGTFGAQVAERILAEFEKLREQLSVKDKQLEAAHEQAKGLQRTIDALISRPAIKESSNFLNGASTESRVIPLWPNLRKAL